MTKTCTKCGVEKELSAFSPQKGGKHGVRSRCRVCANEQKRQKRVEQRAKKQRRKQPHPKPPKNPEPLVPEGERCLNCGKPGTQFPEGHGFRFCEDHAPIARHVLDHPTGITGVKLSMSPSAVESRRIRARRKAKRRADERPSERQPAGCGVSFPPGRAPHR